jgi:hypothetical protein
VSGEKIAVIGGTGALGFGLAVRWARSGAHVLIGSREAKKAQEAAQRVYAMVPAGGRGTDSPLFVDGFENAEATRHASMVVLTVPFPAQIAIVKSIRAELQDAILVDTTVPLAAALGGRKTRLVGVWQGSAAEQVRELVPASVPVLAAFHNLSAEALQNPSVTLDCDVLVCGDDESAKQTLFPLIHRIDGLRPIDAGPLEMARIVEGLTALLISVNHRYKVSHAGIRITGVNSA